MAERKLPMREIKELLSLNWLSEHSHRQIAKICNTYRSTIQEYFKRADHVAFMAKACDLYDTALEAWLYPPNKTSNLS